MPNMENYHAYCRGRNTILIAVQQCINTIRIQEMQEPKE